MEILLQEFFYPSPYIFENNNEKLIKNFEPFFYKEEKKKIIENKILNIKKDIKTHTFTIKENIYNDSLFGCIYNYLCVINPQKYNTFGKKISLIELEEKTHIVNWIKENIKYFQTSVLEHKITKTRVQEIMTMLLTGIYNNLDCLIAYVSYYNISIIVWYSTKNIYCLFTPLKNMNNDIPIIIKTLNGGKKWIRVLNNDDFKIEKCVKIKHYINEKGNVLNCESSYKKSELIDMAKLLNIETDKIGKKELYKKINMYCYNIT